MRINAVNNNTSFGKVYAVAGTKEQLFSLMSETLCSRGFAETFDATNFYKKDRKRGICKSEVEEGKDVMIIVTGKDDTDKIYFDDPDWRTLKDIEKHVSQIYILKNVSEAKDAFAAAIKNLKVKKEILREMLN